MKKASLYFHINNGGVTLAVEDNGDGPCIVLKSSHFGHQTGRVSVNIKRAALGRVASMFTDAAAMEYSPDSCVAAELPRREDAKGSVAEMVADGGPLARLAASSSPSVWGWKADGTGGSVGAPIAECDKQTP